MATTQQEAMRGREPRMSRAFVGLKYVTVSIPGAIGESELPWKYLLPHGKQILEKLNAEIAARRKADQEAFEQFNKGE